MLSNGEFAIIYNRKSGKFERVESFENSEWQDWTDLGFVSDLNLKKFGLNLQNVQFLPDALTRFIDMPDSSIVCIVHMGRLI
jgi:hypothetical protein